MSNDQDSKSPQLIQSSRPFFTEMVENAVAQRKLKTPSATRDYLVGLLEHYMISGNLFAQPSTLAESFLLAANSEPAVQHEMLKRLGDTALYISGFFGDSLHRKVVDIDYYAEIGGSAYSTLARVKETTGAVFLDLAERFLDYVEVLTFISQQALVQSDADLLRLYNRYLSTGSKLAAEQLMEHGVLAPLRHPKISKQ